MLLVKYNYKYSMYIELKSGEIGRKYIEKSVKQNNSRLVVIIFFHESQFAFI